MGDQNRKFVKFGGPKVHLNQKNYYSTVLFRSHIWTYKIYILRYKLKEKLALPNITLIFTLFFILYLLFLLHFSILYS